MKSEEKEIEEHIKHCPDKNCNIRREWYEEQERRFQERLRKGDWR